MVCTRGRIKPKANTKLRLFADSAGHCNRPECRLPLFSEEHHGNYYIAELAHILAANDGGPRAAPEVLETSRNSYSNLILLCPNCHTMVDKCPKQFPDAMLRRWKLEHKSLVYEAVGVRKVSSRSEALLFVEPLLRANRLIHQCYGPDNDYRQNPEAEQTETWKRKVVCQVIPNNQRLLLFMDANTELLQAHERITVERFRQHVDDLVERHLGDAIGTASRFPESMISLFSQQ